MAAEIIPDNFLSNPQKDRLKSFGFESLEQLHKAIKTQHKRVFDEGLKDKDNVNLLETLYELRAFTTPNNKLVNRGTDRYKKLLEEIQQPGEELDFKAVEDALELLSDSQRLALGRFLWNHSGFYVGKRTYPLEREIIKMIATVILNMK